MNADANDAALIRALDAIESGHSLDEALRLLPNASPELRDAVTLAYRLRDLAPSSSPSAERRSLDRMLERSAALQQASAAATPRRSLPTPAPSQPASLLDRLWQSLLGNPPTTGQPRLALALPMLVVLLIVSGVTTVAAQSSLPGDALYPLKRAVERGRLALAPSESRPALIAALEDLRRVEVRSLLNLGRDADVSFVGHVTAAALPQLTVEGFDLTASAECQTEIAHALGGDDQSLSRAVVGHLVRVNGRVTAGRLLALDVAILDALPSPAPVPNAPWPTTPVLIQPKALPPSSTPTAPASTDIPTAAPYPVSTSASPTGSTDRPDDAESSSPSPTDDHSSDDRSGDDKGGRNRGGDDKGGDDGGGRP